MSTIDEALRATRVVIFILSKQFFHSPHCVRELRQSRELGKCVVPLFFDISPDECQPNGLALEMAEDDSFSRFVGGREGWEEDLTWIAGRTGRRLEALDGFWDSCIDLTIQDVARLLGRPAIDIWSKVDNTPFPRNVKFVGRESELEELQGILEKDGRGFVTGIGGMGKTQVLLEYVYRQKGKHAKVLWVDAGSEGRVKEVLELGKHLGVEAEEQADKEEERIMQVREALEGLEVPCLLVLDNVDEESWLRDMLPRRGACQVRKL